MDNTLANLISTAGVHASHAIAADQAGDFTSAIFHYEKTVECLLAASRLLPSGEAKQEITVKTVEYLHRAEQLQAIVLASRSPSLSVQIPEPYSVSHEQQAVSRSQSSSSCEDNDLASEEEAQQLQLNQFPSHLGIPHHEEIIDSFACNHDNRRGRLYILNHRLIFVPSKAHDAAFQVPYSSLRGLSKKAGKAGVAPTRIELHTYDRGTLLFRSFPPVLRGRCAEQIQTQAAEWRKQSAIFGVPLDTTLARCAIEGVPLLVYAAIKQIEKFGLGEEGIFRLSVPTERMEEWKEKWDAGYAKDFAEESSPHVVANVLKKYLRDLPVPLMLGAAHPSAADYGFSVFQQWRVIADQIMDTFADYPALVRQCVQLVSPNHRPLVRFLLEHIALLDSHAEQTRMPLDNLALIFVPIVWIPKLPPLPPSPMATPPTAHKPDLVENTVLSTLLTPFNQLRKLPFLHKKSSHAAPESAASATNAGPTQQQAVVQGKLTEALQAVPQLAKLFAVLVRARNQFV